MKALLIQPGGKPQRIEVESSLEALQNLVGGDIEALGVPGRDDVTAYGNDTAKLVEAPAHNEAASRLLYGDPATARRRMQDGLAQLQEHNESVIAVGHDDPREPYIAGPLLVCGFDAGEGENRDLPDDYVWEF